MKPGDSSPLPEDAFTPDQCVMDLIYMYPQTDLIKTARSRGASAANGLSMLMFQGAEAFRIWTGRRPPTDAMMRSLAREVYETQ
jgi:shikimate dehydrogenase